jgi:ABC-type sugar transport system ATPase subunit
MIECRGLSFHLGDFRLNDINLAISDREYFVILGPTGAGKTVLIECIAGLHHPDRGEIWIGENNVTKLAPEERDVGYVPQDYVLFPFLNVIKNIAFGLKQRKFPKAEIKERVETLANLLGISHLLDRDIHTLSGGEKQRVAIARALAPSPKILLLDEPLSSLDLKTSKYLRLELRRFHRELGITTVHVTHDLTEAEEMGDRIGILNMGRLEQAGRLEEVFFSPENETVSEFIGMPNILDCEHCRVLGQGLIEVSCGGVPIVLPYEGNAVKKIAIFPRDVYISVSKPPGPELNRLQGVVADIIPSASIVRLKVKVGGNVLLTELSNEMFEEMDLKVGQEVFLILKLRRLRYIEAET